MDIQIMDAKSEDTKGMQEVYYKTWLDTYPNKEHNITREDIEYSYKDAFSEESLRKLLERISMHPSNTRYIVAKSDSKIVGVCQPIVLPDKNELQTIYVLPDHQGKGIGTTGRRFSEERFRMKNGSILPEMEMCRKIPAIGKL